MYTLELKEDGVVRQCMSFYNTQPEREHFAVFHYDYYDHATHYRQQGLTPMLPVTAPPHVLLKRVLEEI